MGETQSVENSEMLNVGQFYLVNTVTRLSDGAIIPVHGGLHEDAEIINFPDHHWHIDWRFISTRLYHEYFKLGGGFLMPWAWPISEVYASVDVTKRLLKCKRQFGAYVPPTRIPWLSKLQAKYQNAKMKNFICPHKGLPCNGTPIVDGVVVCRGHGLAFNVETGSLVNQLKTARAAGAT